MSDQRPSPRAFLHNWRHYEGSFGRKLWLTVRNLSQRPLKRQDCCGRPGEPGC